MASEKKKHKLKNSYCVYGALKAKSPEKFKRLLFFTSSERKRLKDEARKMERE